LPTARPTKRGATGWPDWARCRRTRSARRRRVLGWAGTRPRRHGPSRCAAAGGGVTGAADRLDFTAIGPAVNLVSRLEGLCRLLGRPVLISGAVAAETTAMLVPLGETRAARHCGALRGLHPAGCVSAPAPAVQRRLGSPSSRELCSSTLSGQQRLGSPARAGARRDG
jgi:hypothetical protein